MPLILEQKSDPSVKTGKYLKQGASMIIVVSPVIIDSKVASVVCVSVDEAIFARNVVTID